jgi:hypothetical protein
MKMRTWPPDYKEWLSYVESFSRLYQDKTGVTRISHPEPFNPVSGKSGGRLIICSPHPDDEILTGTLPLRLLREDGAAVTNLVMTLGSDRARKEARLAELTAACRVVGFDLLLVEEPRAFDHLIPENEDEQWRERVDLLVDHFAALQPDLVQIPHVGDAHPTHKAVHGLVFKALQLYTEKYDCSVLLLESEYWSSLTRPNLLVGISNEDLALLICALVLHQGEITRNPYHLSLPGRMMDSVRRGSELLDGCGSENPDMIFAEMYTLSWMRGGEQVWPKRGWCIPAFQMVKLSFLKTIFC